MFNNQQSTNESGTEVSQLATTYIDLFKARTDVVGLASTLSTSVSSETELLQYVDHHLDGTLRLGFYNLLPNGTCPWAMVEFEDHGHDTLDDPNGVSLAFLEHLGSAGITAYRERSKNPSGNCYHVWLFFANPLSAQKVHTSLNALLHNAMGIHTEVFPKGYNTNSIGNFVWLPLFGGDGDTWGLAVKHERTVFIDDNGRPFDDQAEFLSKIQTITEEQFDKLVESYRLPVVDRSANDEASGDLEKVRQCAFMKHCEDDAASLSEKEWYAWMTNAIRCVGGREYIHKYSALYPNYNKRETERKISHALADTGPMTHEKIHDWTGFACTCPKKFRAPISRSYYRDIPAEVSRIKAITDIEDRAVEIKALLAYFMRLDPVEQDLYQPMIKKDLRLTNRSFQEAAQSLTPVGYERDINEIFAELRASGADDVKLAQEFFQWLKMHEQASFFTDETGSHYLYVDKRLILIDDTCGDFEALLLRTAAISTATQLGRVVTQVLGASAHLEGKRIKKDTWLHTKPEDYFVYLNLKNENRELVKIGPDTVEVIQNGNNPDNVFMIDTALDKLKPLQYQSMDEKALADALGLVEQLIVHHIPAAEHERWLALAWRMAYPLYDFTTSHLILRAQGKPGMGKTTATNLLSYSLYGEFCLDRSTVAALYSDAAINPLLIDDNLEASNFYGDTGRPDFYLGAATGGGKQKRDGTNFGVVVEKTRALVLCNGIESIAKSEQTNRMMIIECDRDLYGSDYSSAVLLDIKRNRNLIFSANVILTQRVLKRLQQNEWHTVQRKLQQEFPNHPKDRMIEHIGLLVLYLEEFFKAAGKTADVWALVGSWMESQRESAFDEIIGSDPIIRALDLVRTSAVKQQKIESTYIPTKAGDSIQMKSMIKMDYKSLLAEVTVADGNFSITGSAGNLLSSLSTAYKTLGNQDLPVKTSKIFVQRLRSLEKELIEHGYEYKTEEDSHKKQFKYKLSYAKAA